MDMILSIAFMIVCLCKGCLCGFYPPLGEKNEKYIAACWVSNEKIYTIKRVEYGYSSWPDAGWVTTKLDYYLCERTIDGNTKVIGKIYKEKNISKMKREYEKKYMKKYNYRGGGGYTYETMSFSSLRDEIVYNLYAGIWKVGVNSLNDKCIAYEGGNPQWSLDGTRIMYSLKEEKIKELIYMAIYNNSIWIMDADGGNKHKISSPDNKDSNPVWSSKSDMIAFIREGAVWVMKPDGTERRLITDCITDGEYGISCDLNVLSWSIDDKMLLVRANSPLEKILVPYFYLKNRVHFVDI